MAFFEQWTPLWQNEQTDKNTEQTLIKQAHCQ
jgi:hypothetical protein